MSQVVFAADEQGHMSEKQMRDELMTLVFAGHETTTNLIGNGTRALLRHPKELERLRQQPELMASAVEELQVKPEAFDYLETNELSPLMMLSVGLALRRAA